MDAIVVAPATADLIGRVAAGLADDLLSLALMASSAPVLLCPAMNVEMLGNPIVQRNLDALRALGRYRIMEPGEGELACGVVGAGRLPEPPEIAGELRRLLLPVPVLSPRLSSYWVH